MSDRRRTYSLLGGWLDMGEVLLNACGQTEGYLYLNLSRSFDLEKETLLVMGCSKHSYTSDYRNYSEFINYDDIISYNESSDGTRSVYAPAAMIFTEGIGSIVSSSGMKAVSDNNSYIFGYFSLREDKLFIEKGCTYRVLIIAIPRTDI